MGAFPARRALVSRSGSANCVVPRLNPLWTRAADLDEIALQAAAANLDQPLIVLHRRRAATGNAARQILKASGILAASHPAAAALFATSTSARRASFTDFESRNTLATSGSRMTMFAPSPYRSAYLPRTPPEKSYSSRNSSIRPVSGSFLISSPFFGCRQPSADQTKPVTTHRVRHDRKPVTLGHTQKDESVLIERVIRVGDGHRQNVAERRRGFVKPYTVLTRVGACLRLIPLERQRHDRSRSPYPV